MLPEAGLVAVVAGGRNEETKSKYVGGVRVKIVSELEAATAQILKITDCAGAVSESILVYAYILI